MRTVSVFRNNRNQAIRLPKEFEFQGVTELTIEKQGDTILLRPVRPSWSSFVDEPRADETFLSERPNLIEEGRFSFEDGASNSKSMIYMLDTNICSFIMRERPPAVLDRLQQAVAYQNSIAISVITYYEMLLGAFGKNASPRHARTR